MYIEGIKACICEGAAEGAIIDLLVDNGLLIFSREEMLDEKVIRSRTGKNFEEQYLRRGFETKVTVLRILDSHHEKFQLSKAYAHQVDVINVVTAPEIEMLIIHAEGKYEQFVRSRRKPSTFCKETLKMKHVKSREFVMNYFSDPHKLVAAIRRHKQVSQPQRDEIFLYDLLAEEAKNL